MVVECLHKELDEVTHKTLPRQPTSPSQTTQAESNAEVDKKDEAIEISPGEAENFHSHRHSPSHLREHPRTRRRKKR